MPKPILDPKFWERRAQEAQHEHQIVFHCSPDKWDKICQAHTKMLAKIVKPLMSVVDVACGWGRLIDMMPEGWHGDYLGIDSTKYFIDMAQQRYPAFMFEHGDIKDLLERTTQIYDIAILISVRQMIESNLGESAWRSRLRTIWCRAESILYLEYNENEPGRLIEEPWGEEKEIWPDK